MTARANQRLSVLMLMTFIVAPISPAALAQTGPTLVAATNDGTALNVVIPTFNPNIPDNPSKYRDMGVFPRIRRIEAKLMPFLLRETLVESAQWGAVRVVTDPDVGAELQLSGTIVRSDGDVLELRIRAVDATGHVWIDKVFSGQASEETETDEDDESPPAFQAIYDEIAVELAAVRDRIGDAAVSNIKGTSLMIYANELAPSAFNGYLEKGDDGSIRLLRLPARNDPMLKRIEVIRNTEYLITDTVDTKFREFSSDLTRIYRVWREHRRKFVEYNDWNVQFAESRAGDFKRGSWESIKHQYDAYKYDRVAAQEQDRLAIAFNNEVIGTVNAMEVRIAELDGWVDKGYAEWRGLLEEIFELESGSQK
jgi:hypothetical protein